MLVEKDTAYFLHSKPYRENSLIVYLFTQKNGKVSFIIGGVKSTRQGKSTRSPKTALLQPCRPITVSYQLKNGLSKITDMELHTGEQLPDIQYFMLYQYVNELLLKLLPEQLPEPNIFMAYRYFLSLLSEGYPNLALRLMELSIIDYFESFTGLYHDENLQYQVDKTKDYFISTDTGITSEPLHSTDSRIGGEQLSAFNYMISFYRQYLSDNMANNKAELSEHIEVLAKASQPISTFFISRLLGDKQLKTKQIYRELQTRKLL